MGRRKGDTYRKEKLKQFKKIGCPAWTIREDVLDILRDTSKKIKVHQSRIVETALRNMLLNSQVRITDPASVFI